MNDVNLRFFIRTDYVHRDGCVPVFLRAHHNKKQHKIKLPMVIHADNWDDYRQRVLKREPNYIEINMMLDYYVKEARTYLFNTKIMAL
jgi:hypothetical protein